MMNTGSSCGGRYSRPIRGITCYENRILQKDEHIHFWEDCAFCLRNNIYLIVNIDSYLTNSRWRPSNIELRNFVIETKTRLKEFGADRNNCRFTVDNEANEYADFEYYMNMVRVIHDALYGDFDLGAGNFTTRAKDWYEHLARQFIGRYYEVFDFHLQDGLDDGNDIRIYCNWIKYLADKFEIKRIACTEGNNFYNILTLEGHNLLKTQIEYADKIGCESFCFVYANWERNFVVSDRHMAYNIDGKIVSWYWGDMLKLIDSKRTEGDDGLMLEEYYYRNKVTYARDPKKAGVRFIQTVADVNPDSKWGEITDRAVRLYQKNNGLDQDGIVGPDTFRDMMKTNSDAYIDLQYFAAIGRW